MVMFVILAILASVTAGCELPSYLQGQWDSTRAGFQGLTITNTTLSPISADGKALPFSCFLNNGSTYVLRSPQMKVSVFEYNYYFCLDIEKSTSSADIVFFHIRTSENTQHQNDTITAIGIQQPKTLEVICDVNATQLPLHYHLFLKKGYEDRLGNESCPASLQAEFAANFTDLGERAKCPAGFELNGCDHSNVTFNYTQCGASGDQASSGSPVYTCLTSVKNGDVTYTSVALEGSSQQQNNPYRYACLAESREKNGTFSFTKSAGTCGGSPSVTIEATETESCRAPVTSTTTTASPPDSGNSTQASVNSTTTSSSPSKTSPGGGAHAGDRNSCSFASWGLLSVLLPASLILMRTVTV